MNNVLITGGAGFIGSEIVCQLNKAGVKSITVLDSLTEQIHGKDLQNSYLYKKTVGKCKFVKGNLLGFKQSVSLEEGLTQFCDWVKGQEHDNSGYEKSLKEMEQAGMFVRK